jgi:hypothetical protein
MTFGCWQAATASASTVTIAPTVESPANAFPFGEGVIWTPFAGFVYKNLPAFQLKTGDRLAFDLSATNNVNIQLQIDLAATTVNGGDVPSQPFTTVVPNTQTPANPKGDTIHGNFELQYTAAAPFSFPGGGLIIRFSSPSAGYAADGLADSVLTNSGSSTDASGFFVERFFTDADGAAPWANAANNNVGAFRLTLADPPAVASPTGQRAAALAKCKKKHSKKKRKKCRKKANLLPV